MGPRANSQTPERVISKVGPSRSAQSSLSSSRDDTTALTTAVSQLTFEHRIGTAGLGPQRREWRTQVSSREQETKDRCITRALGAGGVFFKRAHKNTTVKLPLYIIKKASKTIKDHFQYLILVYTTQVNYTGEQFIGGLILSNSTDIFH